MPYGYFLRERVLEEVFHFGERGLLVEKLFALQRRQQAIEFVFRLREDVLHQAEGKLPAND